MKILYLIILCMKGKIDVDYYLFGVQTLRGNRTVYLWFQYFFLFIYQTFLLHLNIFFYDE